MKIFLKIVIILAIILVIICGGIFIFFMIGNKVPSDTTYREISFDNNEYTTEYACISFDKRDYSMYDCESEPSGYNMDSEFECKYRYIDNKLIFICKYSDGGHLHIINVDKWDKDTLEFEYKGNKKTFKSESWIEENIMEVE